MTPGPEIRFSAHLAIKSQQYRLQTRDRVGKCRRICPEPLHLAMRKEGAQPSLSRSQNLATGISISTFIISSAVSRSRPCRSVIDVLARRIHHVAPRDVSRLRFRTNLAVWTLPQQRFACACLWTFFSTSFDLHRCDNILARHFHRSGQLSVCTVGNSSCCALPPYTASAR